jgi:pimeloyl-ACP methyl ester carboxylesterase
MIAKYGGPDAAFAAGPAGQRIHYRDQGRPDGPAIVLLHGSNASLHTWEPLVERLGGDYRIVTLDLPGHGLTGGTPDREYDADAMIAAVDVVAARLGLEHFTLGGNSMGGWVAWRYALARAEHVDALLLIDAAGMPLRAGEKRPESNIGFRILQYPFGRWLAARITPRALVERSLRGSVAKQDIVDDAMIDRYWELLRFPGNRQATVARSRMDREPAMAARVGEIAAPTLILFGKQDRLINPGAAQSFHERIAGSEVVLFDEIGHLPMEEAPDATAAAIADFLKRRLLAPPPVRPETR